MAADLDLNALFCPHCGYDLRSLTGDACPECGGDIDHEALHRSQIPWVHRADRGRFRALWSTIWHGTFHADWFAYEVARPVDYRDARRFQAALITWLLGWLALGLGATAALRWIDPGDFVSGWFLAGSAAGFVLAAMFLITATGLPSYWFHPRALPVERQNRAVALSYYASAPLGFLPLAAVVFTVGLAIVGMGEELGLAAWSYAGLAVLLVAVALLFVIALGWWRRCLSLASAAAQRSGGSLAIMGVALPAAWGMLAVLFFVLIPASVAWVWLMVYSLTM